MRLPLRRFSVALAAVGLLLTPGCIIVRENGPNGSGGMHAMMIGHGPAGREHGGPDCTCPMMMQHGQAADAAADHTAPPADPHTEQHQ